MKTIRWVLSPLVLVLIFQSTQATPASFEPPRSDLKDYYIDEQPSIDYPVVSQLPIIQQTQPLNLPQDGWAGSQITSGNGHTCALTATNGVVCWGSNYYGVLGDGTTQQRLVPVDVVGLESGVTAISAGVYHTCALTDGGGVKCWGNNGAGQLGNGTKLHSHTPVDVSSLSSGVAAIAAGGFHTCALTNSGGMMCWGQNLYGQLGNGTTVTSTTPVSVAGLDSGVSSIFAGTNHTCAVIATGGVKCWGSNTNGQVGDGTSHTDRLTPTDVSNLSSGVSRVYAGGYHTCAVLSNADLKCWGLNSSGQLGDGSRTTRLEPVSVLGLDGQVYIVEAGRSHTCAVTIAGEAKCWGYNGYGQVGDNTRTNRNTPVSVSGLTAGILAITGGDWHSCALTTSGEALCWGSNYYGQLGDGTTTQSLIPVFVAIPGSAGSYTISGRVTDENEVPVASVVVSANGDPGLKTATDANGYYTFTNLLPGTYILIPYLEGSKFEPLSRTVQISPAASGVDFSAQPATKQKNPIVFVHGFKGLPPAPPWLCTPEHQSQLTTDADADVYFSIVDDLLKASGFRVYYAHLVSNPCYTQSIGYNAIKLGETIDQAISETNAQQVTLIAHSMGGLVSRSYLEGENLPSDVDHLFTFGTPHHGIVTDVWAVLFRKGFLLSTYCAIYGPALCEFSVSNMFLFNLLNSPRNPNVEYHLISGAYSGPRNVLGILTNILIPGPDDGVAATSSGVSLTEVDDQLPTNEHHNVFGPLDPTSLPNSQRYYNNYFYLRDDYLLSDSYFICLRRILLDEAASCFTAPSLQLLQNADLTQEQHTPIETHNLQPGQTLTLTLGLEGGTTIFASTWQTGTINMTLVDPVGIVIDPFVAVSNPETITYTLDANAAIYRIVDAVPGKWRVVLSDNDLPEDGTSVVTFAAFESPLTLQYGLDRPWYAPNETAIITATLTGMQPSAASITATIGLSDEFSQTLSLIPTGNGIYTTTFTIPDVPGYGDLQIRAKGIRDDGLPFERGATQIFQISPQSIFLNSIYSEQPQPVLPGSSFYSALDINVGVSVQISGTYSLLGNLIATNGQPVAYTLVTRDLISGDQELTLHFDAAQIYTSSLNGPYILTNLTLIDERNGALMVEKADNVYTTYGYHFWQFGNGRVFLPAIMR